MDERGLRRPDGGAIRVLVVDDEPTLSDLLSMALRYEGWEVRAAADGSSAVRTAREFRPDAVVLDVMLPDFDGLEVLRRMRGRRAPRCRCCSSPRATPSRTGSPASPRAATTTSPSRSASRSSSRGCAGCCAAPGWRRRGRAPSSSSATSCSTRTATRSAAPTTSSSSPPPSSSCCASSCATPSACCPRPRSSTGCGTTTSAASPTSSSSTSPTCARRSTPGRAPMIHTVRGAGYVLKPGGIAAACRRRRRTRCVRAWSRPSLVLLAVTLSVIGLVDDAGPAPVRLIGRLDARGVRGERPVRRGPDGPARAAGRVPLRAIARRRTFRRPRQGPRHGRRDDPGRPGRATRRVQQPRRQDRRPCPHGTTAAAARGAGRRAPAPTRRPADARRLPDRRDRAACDGTCCHRPARGPAQQTVTQPRRRPSSSSLAITLADRGRDRRRAGAPRAAAPGTGRRHGPAGSARCPLDRGEVELAERVPRRRPAHRGRPGRRRAQPDARPRRRARWRPARTARCGCASSSPTPATSCAPRSPRSAATPS